MPTTSVRADGAAASLRLHDWPPETVPDSAWAPVLSAFWRSTTGQGLQTRVGAALAHGAVIYPPQPLQALVLTALAEVRVVILGQDPYHQAGQAHGLAFSVQPGIRVPPSLRNILAEVGRDCGGTRDYSGDLGGWARQGVLLLNRVLTVGDSQPASHSGWGWEALSDAALAAVNALKHPVAFLLWGTQAQQLRHRIDSPRHRVWVASHPSPLSARRGAQPFIGCGHFGAVNRWFGQQGLAAIEW